MSDVSKTNELITEAADRLRNYYEAGEMIHMASSYRTGDGVTHIIDFEDLRTVVEAATRVPVQGGPNDELIEYALDYIENVTMRPERREALRALASRATVPDAATAALERVRGIHANAGPSQGYDSRFKGGYGMLDDCCAACGSHGEYGVEWPCPTIAALDGAPEPEWEYTDSEGDPGPHHLTRFSTDLGTLARRNENRERMGHGPLQVYRRRKAGPWLPVEGESND